MGEVLLVMLAQDLSTRYGRGFSKSNIFNMRAFYLAWEIFQTPSGIFAAQAKCATLLEKSSLAPSEQSNGFTVALPITFLYPGPIMYA